MNIGMILDIEFPPDMRVENEIIALKNAGYNVIILSVDLGERSLCNDFYGAQIIRIKKSKKCIKRMRALTNTFFNFYPKFWAKHIIDFVNDYDIDVLHIHDLYMFGAGFMAQRKIKKKIKIIGDLHENYVEGLKFYKFANSFPGNLLISIPKWERIEMEWCKKSDFLITVIDEAVERYEALGIPRNKLTVVENYVNQHNFLNIENNSDIPNKFKDTFVITYIGGFDIHRGLESVINAIPEIIKNHKDIKFVFVGKGRNSNELHELSKKYGVDKYVAFEGWQEPSKLPIYISISDICLIPHLKTIHTDNTIPHKLFHYMLLEKAVVASNCNPIKRIIEESKCGLVYESGNSKEFSDKIIKLYDNPELRKKMGKNGKKAVESKYNWNQASKRLIDLYRKVENGINN